MVGASRRRSGGQRSPPTRGSPPSRRRPPEGGAGFTRQLFAQVFDLGDDAIELIDEFGSTRGRERFDERPVVPERAVLSAGEPRPQVFTEPAVIAQDRARVVQLVRSRDE